MRYKVELGKWVNGVSSSGYIRAGELIIEAPSIQDVASILKDYMDEHPQFKAYPPRLIPSGHIVEENLL